MLVGVGGVEGGTSLYVLVVVGEYGSPVDGVERFGDDSTNQCRVVTTASTKSWPELHVGTFVMATELACGLSSVFVR